MTLAHLFKRVFQTAFLLVALVAAGMGYLIWSNWYYQTRPAGMVDVLVSFKPTQCDPKHPLMVEIKNRSFRKVDAVKFEIEARIPGRSTNVAQSNWITNDTILKPSSVGLFCYSPPDLRAPYTTENPFVLLDYEWSIGLKAVDFADE